MHTPKLSDSVYVLDTDTTTQLSHGKNETLNQRVRVAADQIWLPVIVAQEQLQGRLAAINRLNHASPSDSAKFPIAYQNLMKTQEFLAKFPLLPYTPDDEALFQSLPPDVKRAGPNDCRIAVIAVNRGFTVVTCNLRHFQQIPAVKCVDWTI